MIGLRFLYRIPGILLFLGLFLCMMAPSLLYGAEEAYNVKFVLYDVYNNSEIKADQAVIKATFREDSSLREFRFEEHNGTVSPVVFSLREGKWEFYITADDYSSPVLDYQIIHSTEVEGPLTQRLFLLRVGTVKGIVKDKAGKLVSGAQVKFECSREDFVGQLKTDLFGSFSSSVVPAGKCRVFASYQNSAGVNEVLVEKGEVSEVEVFLDEEVVGGEIRFYIILIGIVVAGIIFMYIFFRLRRKHGRNVEFSRREKSDKDLVDEGLDKSRKSQQTHQEDSDSVSHQLEFEENEPQMSEILDYSVKEEEHKLSKRSQDILNSLPEGEQKILKFIVDQGNQTSQARIHRIAKIPKSTLHRNLKSLEEKNIVKVEKKKGRNRIYLTEYFLSER